MEQVDALLPALEAILFVAEEPVPLGEVAEVLEVPVEAVAEALALLQQRLTERDSGLVLRQAGEGWRLYTRADVHPYLERFATTSTATRLSKAALETLAVVAYRQPVSRGQVSEIRGVDSEHALGTLERHGLIDRGRAIPGARASRPLWHHRPLLGEARPQVTPGTAAARRPRPSGVGSRRARATLPTGADIERLQRPIAHSGLASRRAAEEMIRAGRVTVDGFPAHLGQKVDPATARVEVDGIPLPIRPGLVYYLLYKPRGALSTAADPQGRCTVVTLVPSDTRVYPVGRLDADSEGLMILTNDGDLAAHVTHPRYGVTKTYLCRVDGSPGPRALRSLVEGIDLEDGPARACSARVIGGHGGEALVEVIMKEGRKREVRRMLEAVGHRVTSLARTSIGPISDRTLKPGVWRELTVAEVRSLYLP